MPVKLFGRFLSDLNDNKVCNLLPYDADPCVDCKELI